MCSTDGWHQAFFHWHELTLLASPCPASCLVFLGNNTNAHVTTQAIIPLRVASGATTGEDKSVWPSTIPGDIFFLWIWETILPIYTPRAFPGHAENLTQCERDGSSPFYVSLPRSSCPPFYAQGLLLLTGEAELTISPQHLKASVRQDLTVRTLYSS